MNLQKMVEKLQIFLKKKDIEWDRTVYFKGKRVDCTDRLLRHGKNFEFTLTINGNKIPCNIDASSNKLKIYGWFLAKHYDSKGNFMGVETEIRKLLYDYSKEWSNTKLVIASGIER